jgi:hypothetical protein
MFRRFLIAVLIFLIVVVVVADRIGAIVGAHVLAGKVQTDEHLQNRPSASIGGFPFLTQAFNGKYKDVTITGHNVVVDGVTVNTLVAHLHGVHLPFGKVIHGSVSQVPVDSVNGTAFVSFANANAYLSKHLTGEQATLSGGPGHSVNVVDRLRLGGKKLSLDGVGTVSVSDSVVVVHVAHLSGAETSGSGADTQTLRLAVKRLRIAVPLQELPFRMNVTSVAVSPTGLTGTGSATKIVLGSRGQ